MQWLRPHLTICAVQKKPSGFTGQQEQKHQQFVAGSQASQPAWGCVICFQNRLVVTTQPLWQQLLEQEVEDEEKKKKQVSQD